MFTKEAQKRLRASLPTIWDKLWICQECGLIMSDATFSNQVYDFGCPACRSPLAQYTEFKAKGE